MSNHISYTGNERLFAEQLFESRWYDNWPESYIKEYFDECKEDKETPIVDKNTARNLANILKNNNFNLTSIFYPNGELANIPNGQLIDKFYETVKDWYCDNGRDCVIGINLGDESKNCVRNGFNIPIDETILFVRDTSFWSNRNQGLVITDKGFYVVPNNDDTSSSFYFSWKDFNQVRYQELTFYVNNANENIARLRYSNFVKGQIDLSWFGPSVANALTEVAALAIPDTTPYDLIEQKDFDGAVALARQNLEADPNSANYNFVLGRTLLTREWNKNEPDNSTNDNLQEALKVMDKAYVLTDEDNKEDLSTISLNKGFINEQLGWTYAARNQYIRALDGCNADDWNDYMGHVENSEKELQDLWNDYTTTYEYKDRKFLMPVKDVNIAGCVAEGIDVFRMSNIPSCLQFPMGHPVANELYIGHPYNNSLYVPFSESEDIFFLDKIHELVYLLECLGAEEISITSVKGKSISEFSEGSQNLKASADIKLVSGQGEKSGSYSQQNESSANTSRTMSIKLDPQRSPYVPDNLIWYKEQPQWQRLVNSRMDGNMLEYNEFVSTSQTKFTSGSEMNDIKGSARYLWMKVGGEVETNMKTQFKETEETQWKVEVKFRSLKQFALQDDGQETLSNASPQQALSDVEQSYKEEVEFCLEEMSEIDDSSRKFLERKRKKLGLSEERAKEIEDLVIASLSPSYSEEEQEFLELLEDVMVDGEIPASAKRLIEREQKSLGLSDERVKELIATKSN